MPSYRMLSVLLPCLMVTWIDATEAQERLQFNRDIRPILSAACFRCHGLDANKRQADLRLDLAEAALASHDGHQAIKPGVPAESDLIARIETSDEGLVMPPREAARQLTPKEKETLRRWIEQGATYESHWAFAPLQVAELPPALPVYANWSQPIDRFLLHAMNARGLTPQPEADHGTLLRRLSFTLTGLPPTLEEIRTFESDPSPAAYERMVDHYLASPGFGEEMARHWLDVARYGDTHGLHLDNERQIWAYRDWVVKAFQQNLPFSEFTIEQLAGDLLPNPTLPQLTATGFNRCNVTTSEGGAIDEEFLFRYAVDRASTTAEAWLGLTAGCAVCHDHKYDPLPSAEFYSLYAFFYSAADPAMDGNTNTTAPFQRLASNDTQSRTAFLDQQLANAKQRMLDLAKTQAEAGNVPPTTPPHQGASRVHDVWIDDQFPVGSGSRNTSRNTEVWWDATQSDIPLGRRALYQEFGDKFEQTITGGLVPRTIPTKPRLRCWVRLDSFDPSQALFVECKSDSLTERWIWCDQSELASRVDGQAAQIIGRLPERGKWSLLEWELPKWTPGTEVKELKFGQWGGKVLWDGLICVGEDRVPEDLRLSSLAWWKSRVGKDTPETTPELNAAIKAGPESELGIAQRDAVQAFFLAWIAVNAEHPLQVARQDWYDLRVQRAMHQDAIPGTMVFRDLPKPRTAYVMKRGQYDQKGEEVVPKTPSFLPASASLREKQERLNRLDLAKWLVSEDQPLTVRVTVNRFWQQVFGTGIVATSDDFGSQGAPPTHPELLDWLAHDFRGHGWDVKRLMKQLVMTSAFRQAAVCSDAALQIDPTNRWLARGPRIRLDAEQIRDNVLAVSGLLNPTIGGPPVRVYQPANIWEPVGYADSNTRYYLQDHGDALYRRSLYVLIKRTAPPPFMSNFDAPNRELFCSRRERSNTPLQALQLMNDVQHVEAARKLAERLLREGGWDPVARIRFAYRLILARAPDSTELAWTLEALRGFESKFASAPANAEQLLQVGESSTHEALNPSEVAAYTLLANLLLNLDETVTRN